MLLVLALLVSMSSEAPHEVATHEEATEVRWVRASGDDLTEVAGYRVEGYRDAGRGGIDWTLEGSGVASGWGRDQLWLMSSPMAARTTLAVPSEAVAFMMDGDRNDGIATFLVDGVEVGTFDMFGRSMQTLVVEGLPLRQHTLEVRMTGQKHRRSRAPHVALWGGSALVREIVAAR